MRDDRCEEYRGVDESIETMSLTMEALELCYKSALELNMRLQDVLRPSKPDTNSEQADQAPILIKIHSISGILSDIHDRLVV